ncbi:MAG: hypothetical protein ACFN4F_01060 [Porphyromonas endodontalis]|uniref:hypothetical protein n=1 Tax=Porphyromonas endodontalis TaxID=28124 RepID=UPI00360F3E8B
MEYVGYVICSIIAYFTFRIGWRIFGKTLSRWQRHRMSEWTFFQKRLAYSIALAFIFGGIPAYVIFSYSHPNHKESFMNLNKENKESNPPETLKFIDVGTFNETNPDKEDLDGNTKKNSDDDISSSQEESLDGNTINDSDDDISLPQEENKIREPDFHSKDSIQ